MIHASRSGCGRNLHSSAIVKCTRSDLKWRGVREQKPLETSLHTSWVPVFLSYISFFRDFSDFRNLGGCEFDLQSIQILFEILNGKRVKHRGFQG